MFAAPSFAAIFDASGHSECRRRLLTSTLAHSDIKTGLDQIRNYEVDALPELSALSRELSTLQQSYNRANNDLSFREKNEHTKAIDGIAEEIERLHDHEWPQPETFGKPYLPGVQTQVLATPDPRMQECNLPLSSARHRIETGAMPQSLSNQTSQHVKLTPDFFGTPSPQPVTLSNITSSLIDIRFPFRTASVSAGDIHSSLLLLGHVSGKVRLTSFCACTVVVSADEAHIDMSTDLTVYLLSASPPIIRNCTGIRFTSAPPSLVSSNEAIGGREEYGSQVIDVSWDGHGANPNWSLLDGAKRIADDDWVQTLQRGDDEEIDVLLRRVVVDNTMSKADSSDVEMSG